MILLIIGAVIGFIFGFFACALLSSGKMTDLESHILWLQNENSKLKERLRAILHKRSPEPAKVGDANITGKGKASPSPNA